jgi:hypothetical protein
MPNVNHVDRVDRLSSGGWAAPDSQSSHATAGGVDTPAGDDNAVADEAKRIAPAYLSPDPGGCGFPAAGRSRP